MNSVQVIQLLITYSLATSLAQAEILAALFSYQVLTSIGAGLLAYYKRNEIGRKIGLLEDCTDLWVPTSLDGLESDLRDNVFGQRLAINAVLSSLKGHYTAKKHRPLVLSFQGGPGTGKSLTAQLIIKNIFFKGLKSNFVEYIYITRDFPTIQNVPLYKAKLTSLIIKKLLTCNKAMFILDEIDFAYGDLLTALIPFLTQSVDIGTDYSNATFILISNHGHEEILQEVVELKQLKPYNQFLIEDFSGILRQSISEHLRDHKIFSFLNLITKFIPFLPMEENPVIECVKKGIERFDHTATEKLIKAVMDEIQLTNYKDLKYSESGCKRLIPFIELVIPGNSKKQLLTVIS